MTLRKQWSENLKSYEHNHYYGCSDLNISGLFGTRIL
jgi:hypothetical protein